MDSLRSERRQTGSNEFGALASGGAILHPLSGPGDHRLTCGNVEHASFMCDAWKTFEHDRELVESGIWPGSIQPPVHLRWALPYVLPYASRSGPFLSEVDPAVSREGKTHPALHTLTAPRERKTCLSDFSTGQTV